MSDQFISLEGPVPTLILTGVLLWLTFRFYRWDKGIRDSVEREVADRKAKDAAFHDAMNNRAILKDRKNPSHDVHANIETKLGALGRRYNLLEVHERHFLRAYAFDSYQINGGIDTYFLEGATSEAEWYEAEEALAAVGANGMLAVFTAVLQSKAMLVNYYVEGKGSIDSDVLRDWDQRLSDAREGSDYSEKQTYMERLLDAYVLNFYTWKEGPNQ